MGRLDITVGFGAEYSYEVAEVTRGMGVKDTSLSCLAE